MAKKFLQAKTASEMGDGILCPRCGYQNPRPRLQIMTTVSHLLCRSCGHSFPLPKDEEE